MTIEKPTFEELVGEDGVEEWGNDVSDGELSLVSALANKQLELAAQVAQLEAIEIIEEYLNSFSFPTEESRKLSKVALLNYTGAAIIMPYKLFYEEKDKPEVMNMAKLFNNSMINMFRNMSVQDITN